MISYHMYLQCFWHFHDGKPIESHRKMGTWKCLEEMRKNMVHIEQ